MIEFTGGTECVCKSERVRERENECVCAKSLREEKVLTLPGSMSPAIKSPSL